MNRICPVNRIPLVRTEKLDSADLQSRAKVFWQLRDDRLRPGANTSFRLGPIKVKSFVQDNRSGDGLRSYFSESLDFGRLCFFNHQGDDKQPKQLKRLRGHYRVGNGVY